MNNQIIERVIDLAVQIQQVPAPTFLNVNGVNSSIRIFSRKNYLISKSMRSAMSLLVYRGWVLNRLLSSQPTWTRCSPWTRIYTLKNFRIKLLVRGLGIIALDWQA